MSRGLAFGRLCFPPLRPSAVWWKRGNASLRSTRARPADSSAAEPHPGESSTFYKIEFYIFQGVITSKLSAHVSGFRGHIFTFARFPIVHTH